MKVSILQENLAQVVAVAGRSTSSAKASLPVLTHILLSTQEGRLLASATNLEVGVKCSVSAKIEEEGSLAVPSRVLQDLVGSLPAGKIDLLVEKGNLKLSAEGVEASIAGIDGSEFPAIPDFSKDGAISIAASLLSTAVNDVSYAAASDESRPVLTGILWRIKEGGMELVATDGYRLARKVVTLEGEIRDWQVVVPARSLAEVAKLVSEQASRGENPDEVKVSLNDSENQISFHVGNVALTSRLIDGQYPPFENIIPSEFVVRGVFSRENLLRALRQAAVFARDIGQVVKVATTESSLEISANTAQIGEEKTQLVGEIEGEEIKAAFNSRYLLDVLGHMSANQVSFEIKSSLSPGVLRQVGDESLTTLVMPVKVQGS
jgi:DNA polymerase-3 subunit beta